MGFNSRIRCAAAALFLALAWSLPGADEKDSSPATQTDQRSRLRPGDVQLDASQVYVHVFKQGLGHEHAVTGRLRSGKLRLGQELGAGSLEFDMASFSADTQAARKSLGLAGMLDASTMRKTTENMLGPDVLDVKRFPSATFVIKSSLELAETNGAGERQYRLSGEFTLHGVTRPLEFLVTTETSTKGRAVRGRFSILQSDYGIKPYSTAFGTVGVADRIEIRGELLLVSEPGNAR